MSNNGIDANNVLLKEILLELKKITNQLNSIQSALNLDSLDKGDIPLPKSEIDSGPPSSLNILNIQELRPGIFKTYKAIQKREDWSSAKEVCQETGRSRGLESRYLNYLAENGFIMKKRVKLEDEEKATAVLYKHLEVSE